MKRDSVVKRFAYYTSCLIFLLGSGQVRAETFSIISLNTWGVPFASYDRWRYGEAMEELQKRSPDLIALQEVFTPKGKREFRHEDYPYQVSGPRAIPRLISSGLRILSKHPILRSAKLVYRACKKDDCLSRKGALLAVIRLPSGRALNLVVTHLNARGTDATRQDQLDQLKTFIDWYREPGAPLAIAGDFNFTPESALYPKLLKDLGVQDLWTQTQPANNPGYTNDCELNPYARDYSRRYGFPLVRERIDYLFSENLRPLRSQMIFNEGKLILSDHFGLQAEYSTELEPHAQLGESPLANAPEASLAVGLE